MTLLKTDVIRTMDSFVGIHEVPDGTNCTVMGEEYGWNCVAWCAITVSNALTRCGFPLHTAAVIIIEQLARRGWNGMSWSDIPVVGSAVCFDWKGHGNPNDMHTGLVYFDLENGQFRTIEGNYRNRVDRWLRDMKYVRGFACFPYGESPQPQPIPQPPPEDEDMKVHLYQANPGTADGVVPTDDVFVVAEDHLSFRHAPNEQWLATVVDRIGVANVMVIPQGGTESDYYKNLGIRNVEVVGGEFLRPIITG